MNPHNIAAIFLAAVAIGMCIPSWVDRWAARNVDRMVDDGLAAITAEDIAAHVWAEHEADRHRAVAEARMDEWMRRTNLTPRDPFTATRDWIASLDTTEDR